MRRRDVLVLMGAIVAPWSSEAGAETPKVIAFVLPAASPAEMAGPDPLMPVARFFVHACGIWAGRKAAMSSSSGISGGAPGAGIGDLCRAQVAPCRRRGDRRIALACRGGAPGDADDADRHGLR
jgi:hypothetical protein